MAALSINQDTEKNDPDVVLDAVGNVYLTQHPVFMCGA